MDKIKFILNHLYALYEIPMRCVSGQEVLFMPGGEFQYADPLVLDKSLINSLISKCIGSPFLELENNNILYGVCKDLKGLTCIIGPVALTTLSRSELYKYKSEHGLLNYNDFKIKTGSIVRSASVIALLHSKMNNEDIDLSIIIDQLNSKNCEKKITEKDLVNYDLQKSEQERERLPQNVEITISTAFANGDLETLEALMETNMVERVGQMAKVPFKQMEYTAVSGITVFCRAAIQGGAGYDEVFRISDIYLQKISQSKNELELQNILKSITIDLCECVRRAKERHNGLKYIEQCKRFVAKNLHNRFTLEDIADAIGISKFYLTSQFTKQEGKSLKKYIHEERIKSAQGMLKYSDMTIYDIASYLCFDSQSHFGSVFKKITGVTPAAYRIEMRLNEHL